MFRLYRKGGFKRGDAIQTLVKALAFRMKHFQDLTWSPTEVKMDHEDSITPFDWAGAQKRSPVSRNRSDSRTSAQSPQPSPISPVYADYEENEARDSWRNSAVRLETPKPIESLIQAYPPSANDPNSRPLAIIALKHLYESANGSNAVSPKTQILAAFERSRRYLARRAIEGRGADRFRTDKSSSHPLQLVLVINLEGGRVTSTVSIISPFHS
jgi:hypothetical protein